MVELKFNSFHSDPILKYLPPFITDEDGDPPIGDVEGAIRFWERLLRKYKRYGRHPYLLVRYASAVSPVSPGHALFLLEEAHAEMAARDVESSARFEDLIAAFTKEIIYEDIHTCT
ncbi:unnamed protein product [Peniophora sp. CBMAI 1063]|nr:unnamed protein product [Peniophora sp. CBMAI 1063]